MAAVVVVVLMVSSEEGKSRVKRREEVEMEVEWNECRTKKETRARTHARGGRPEYMMYKTPRCLILCLYREMETGDPRCYILRNVNDQLYSRHCQLNG